MKTATHLQRNSHERLRLVEHTGIGSIAIFENLDSPYPCYITCPATPDFVTPYKELDPAQDRAEQKADIRVLFAKRASMPQCFHKSKFFA